MIGYIIPLLFIILHPSTQLKRAAETSLLKHLRTNISMYVRPVLDKRDPVNVQFGFELIHLVNVDESSQSIQVKVWLRMKWMNQLMRWDPKKWGINQTRVNPGDIWTPDIYLMEDIGNFFYFFFFCYLVYDIFDIHIFEICFYFGI